MTESVERESEVVYLNGSSLGDFYSLGESVGWPAYSRNNRWPVPNHGCQRRVKTHEYSSGPGCLKSR